MKTAKLAAWLRPGTPVKRHFPTAMGLALIAQFPGPCLASDAPAALRGKTIEAAYRGQVTAYSEYGQVTAGERDNLLTIYVSSIGRVFVKGRSQSRGGSLPIAVAPSQQFRFEGGTLVGIFPNISGASRVMIHFSPDYGSCNLNAASAKENGKPRAYMGTDGNVWASNEPTKFTQISCSIRDGNALAN
jgi:hypothetical protein